MQILSFALINLLGCIYNRPVVKSLLQKINLLTFVVHWFVHSLPIIDNIDTVE